MQKFLSLIPLAALAALPHSVALAAPTATKPAEAIIRVESSAIPVKVSGTGELNTLALRAFRAHGAFALGSNRAPSFDIRFSTAGANAVKVDVIDKTGTTILSQAAQGSNLPNALYRAADLAVTKTTGLPGFFASKLAFLGSRNGSAKTEVWVSDLFLTDALQVTKDNASVYRPRWSPDGGKLVYTSYYQSGFPDIFQIDLGSMNRTTLVKVKGTNFGATYSPDGSKIAMVLSGSGNPEIYVTDARGRFNGAASQLTRTDGVEASPCWSPDGSRIVFTSDMRGRPGLYLMSSSGGSAQPLSTGYSYAAEPDWSRAKPNLIAFTAGVKGGHKVAIFDLKTNTSREIKNSLNGDVVEPSWLPDGRHLVVTLKNSNSRRLHILDTETGVASAALTPFYADSASVWSR
jgi:TolB protein